MTQKENTWTLLFDGDCSLCMKYASGVERFDRDSIINTMPLQNYKGKDPEIPLEELLSQLHLISPVGDIFRGEDAVEMVISLIPRAKPLSWMIRTKPGKSITRTMYNIIKRMRCRNCN